MSTKQILPVLLFLFMQIGFAQFPAVTKVEPPNWWAGMKLHQIQLMIYGNDLNNMSVSSSSRNLHINGMHSTLNKSYLFIDIDIDSLADPGDYKIELSNAQGTTSFSFPVLARDTSAFIHQGFSDSDVMYLIMPDRFSNGDINNDNAAGMIEKANRNYPDGRHGGDLQGIINKLDYLSGLNVTALWITPSVENNMARLSYHGYAATDLYKIDLRIGSNALYRSFVEEAHRRNLKVIMDHVNNHIGTNHPWAKNLPEPDWLNGSITNHPGAFHYKPELDDIHTDSLTKRRAVVGWFVNEMADLNQADPFVANYLIQNAIWWVEFSGVDGIREDTYPYQEPSFRERWCKAIMDEYPRFNIVGEVWIGDPVFLAPYQRGSFIPRKVKPELPAITDYALYDAFLKCFADSTGKIETVFEDLTKDFLFPRPDNMVTFADNHDVPRLMYKLHGNVNRFKLALANLLTTRGIPQLLYGTELGITGGT